MDEDSSPLVNSTKTFKVKASKLTKLRVECFKVRLEINLDFTALIKFVKISQVGTILTKRERKFSEAFFLTLFNAISLPYCEWLALSGHNMLYISLFVISLLYQWFLVVMSPLFYKSGYERQLVTPWCSYQNYLIDNDIL